jgi:hypothetical protein
MDLGNWLRNQGLERFEAAFRDNGIDSVMRSANWTPSIVPSSEDEDVCLVVDDFGRRGRAYCETDVETTDLETVIHDLLDGQYSNPVRVVSFNTAEGRSRDISADIADELRRRCDLQMRDIHPRFYRAV